MILEFFNSKVFYWPKESKVEVYLRGVRRVLKGKMLAFGVNICVGLKEF